MNLVSSRLAARTGTRQLDALHRADRAADAADRAVVQLWDRLIAILVPGANAWLVQQHAQTIISQEIPKVYGAVHGELAGLARWGHDAAADALVDTLPLAYLKSAASRRTSNGLVESRLLEDLPRNRPGFIQFGVARTGRLTYRDKAGRLREPVRNRLDPEQQRRLFKQLLFPPPDETTVHAILRQPIQGRTWHQDLSQATQLAQPDQWANLFVAGYSRGLNPREIAKQILPAVQQVKSTARRVARTYGVQVAHAVQMQAHEQLGDLIIGYQVHALLDQHTRPWHAHRSGTIYYKEPTGDQKGYAQMPHPPLEAQDPGERPAGTPQTAWH